MPGRFTRSGPDLTKLNAQLVVSVSTKSSAITNADAILKEGKGKNSVISFVANFIDKTEKSQKITRNAVGRFIEKHKSEIDALFAKNLDQNADRAAASALSKKLKQNIELSGGTEKNISDRVAMAALRNCDELMMEKSSDIPDSTKCDLADRAPSPALSQCRNICENPASQVNTLIVNSTSVALGQSFLHPASQGNDSADRSAASAEDCGGYGNEDMFEDFNPPDDYEFEINESKEQEIFDMSVTKPCELGISMPQNFAEVISAKKRLSYVMKNVKTNVGDDVSSISRSSVEAQQRIKNFWDPFTAILNRASLTSLLKKNIGTCERKCLLAHSLFIVLLEDPFMDTFENIKSRFLEYKDESDDINFFLHIYVAQGYAANDRYNLTGDRTLLNMWCEGRDISDFLKVASQSKNNALELEECSSKAAFDLSKMKVCEMQFEVPHSKAELTVAYENLKWTIQNVQVPAVAGESKLMLAARRKSLLFGAMQEQYAKWSELSDLQRAELSENERRCLQQCSFIYLFVTALLGNIHMFVNSTKAKQMLSSLNTTVDLSYFVDSYLRDGFDAYEKYTETGNLLFVNTWREQFRNIKTREDDDTESESKVDISPSNIITVAKNTSSTKVIEVINESETDCDDSQVTSSKEKPSSFTDCNLRLGKLRLTSRQWEDIHEFSAKGRLKLNTINYPTIVIDCITQQFKLGCCLVIRDWKLFSGKGKLFDIRAYCKHVNCPCKYILRLKKMPEDNVDVQLIFFTNTKNADHGNVKLSRPCKGLARAWLRDSLKHDTAQNAMNSALLAADEEVISKGYTPAIYSDSVVRKVKSEGLALLSKRQDPDDFKSVMIKFASERKNAAEGGEESFIQKIGRPLCCVLYTLSQMKILEGLKQKVAYFDATGSICRSFGDGQNYYYAMVVQHEGKTLPIIEFFLEKHDNVSVSEPLRQFNYDYKIRFKLKTPMLTDVVVDFSWSLIKAVLASFNENMTIEGYLRYCYQLAQKIRQKRSANVTHVHLCCAHMMKNVSVLAKETFKDSKARKFAKEIFAIIIDCKNLQEGKDFVRDAFSVFLSPTCTPYFEEKIKALLAKVQNLDLSEFVIEDADTDDEVEFEDTFLTMETQAVYRKSKFYDDFSLIFNEVKTEVQIDNSYPKNIYYNEVFAKKILVRYLSYFPLISAFTIPEAFKVKRFSNAPIEGFNKIRKYQIMEKKRNISLDSNVELSRNYLQALLLRFKHNIRSSNNTKNPTSAKSKKRKAGDSDEEDTFVEEKWGKKRKLTKVDGKAQVVTHFGAKSLKDLHSKLSKNQNFAQTSTLISQPPKTGSIIATSNFPTVKSATNGAGDAISDASSVKSIALEDAETEAAETEAAELEAAELEAAELEAAELEAAETEVEAAESKAAKSVTEFSSPGDAAPAGTIAISSVSRRRYSFRKSNGLVPTRELLANNLVADPNYYQFCDKLFKNYTICLFGKSNDSTLTRAESAKIAIDSKKANNPREIHVVYSKVTMTVFDSLRSKTAWMSNNLIDILFILFLKKYDLHEKVLAVSVEATMKFVNVDDDRYGNMQLNNKYAIKNLLETQTKILLPLLKKNHFVLFVVCNETKKIKYYNSYKDYYSTIEEQVMIENVKKRFLNRFLVLGLSSMDTSGYTFERVECNKQTDGSSCGSAICLFAISEIKNEPLDLSCSLPDFRSELCKLMLESSLDVQNLCLVCNKLDFIDEASCKNWVQCDHCDRWFHTECLTKKLKISPVTLEEEPFTCSLCELTKI